MKKLISIPCIVMMSVLCSWAQYDLVYQNAQQVYKNANHVSEDAAGDIFTAGVFSTSLTLGGITLINNTSGNLIQFIAKYQPTTDSWQWAKKISPALTPSSGATLLDMKLDGQGNAYITGHFFGKISFDNITLTSTKSTYYTTDLFIAKLNTNGSFVWAKSLGTKTGEDRGNAITLDESGNIYVTGSFCNKIITCGENGPYEVTDIYVAKLNNSGTVNWQKRFAPGSLSCLTGGAGYDLVVDPSGNIYLTGRYSGSVSFGSGAGLTTTSVNGFDAFTLKLNNSGIAQWVRGAPSSDYSCGLEIEISGEKVFVAGVFNVNVSFGEITLSPNTNFEKVFVVSYSSGGNGQWAISAEDNQADVYVNSILPVDEASLVISMPLHGTKTLFATDGSILSTLPITDNFYSYNNVISEKSYINDMDISANGFVFALTGNCGTVGFDNLLLTSSCNDCANWDSCQNYNYSDIFLFRSSGGSVPCTDTDSDGVCDTEDLCPLLPDSLIWTPCDDGNPCTTGDVYTPYPDCVCVGYQEDPNCDYCNEQYVSLLPNPLIHQGPGVSSTSHLNFPAGSGFVEYTISGLDAVINGPTSNRYIDRVNVYLINGNGVTLHYGTFNGTQQNSVNVVLQGPVQSVWVTLEDGYDGNSAVQQNVAFSTVLYCNGEPQLPPGSNNIAVNAIQADGLEREDISLFPNPAQDVLHVSLPDIDGEITIWIQDQFGENLWSENVRGLRSTMTIDLNENRFQNGIYYLVYRGNGELKTKRFVIAE